MPMLSVGLLVISGLSDIPVVIGRMCGKQKNGCLNLYERYSHEIEF